MIPITQSQFCAFCGIAIQTGSFTADTTGATIATEASYKKKFSDRYANTLVVLR